MRRLLVVFMLGGCGDDSAAPSDAPITPTIDARGDAPSADAPDVPIDAPVDGRVDAPPPGPPTFGILSGGGLAQDSTLRLQLFIGEVQVGASADGTMSVEWGLAGRSVAP